MNKSKISELEKNLDDVSAKQKKRIFSPVGGRFLRKHPIEILHEKHPDLCKKLGIKVRRVGDVDDGKRECETECWIDEIQTLSEEDMDSLSSKLNKEGHGIFIAHREEK